MCGGGGDDPEEQRTRLAMAEDAAVRLQQYGRTFYQLENQEIDAARRQFDPANYERAVAAGMQQAAQEYEPALQALASGAARRGYDPGSGAFQSQSEALRGAQARAMGLAGADRAISNTDLGFNRLSNIVAMGQGQEVDAFKGQMELADRASDRLRDQARRDFVSSTALQNTLGTFAGGTAAYGLNNRRIT
tara:strand:+ start:4326 stop:4898 length:573 start_codon:yes stop_codon:yes gene_type:complete